MDLESQNPQTPSPADDDIDISSGIVKKPAASAPAPNSRAYDSNAGRPDWSLDQLGDVQSYYQDKYNKPLPLANRGQGTIHNRLGLDHRNAADISINPTSPEGSDIREYLRSQDIPFSAFDRAIPGVATGPHIHVGYPSHHTTQQYAPGSISRPTSKSVAAPPAAPATTAPESPESDDDIDISSGIVGPSTPTGARKPTVTDALSRLTDYTNKLTQNVQAQAAASDKLAHDIDWHFGSSVLAAFPTLPPAKQKQIAQMATQFAAQGAGPRDANGFVRSPAWQLKNQRAVGGIEEGTDIPVRHTPEESQAEVDRFNAAANPLLQMPSGVRAVVQPLAQGGADIMNAAGGALRYAGRLGAGQMWGGAGISSAAPNPLERAAKYLEGKSADVNNMSAEADRLAPYGLPANLAMRAGRGVVGMAPLMLAPEAEGLGILGRMAYSAGAFGGYSGLQSAGRGESAKEQLKAAGEGALYGAPFGAAESLAAPFTNPIARAALKASIVGPSTYGISSALGNPNPGEEAAMMAGFAGIPELAGLRRGPTNEDFNTYGRSGAVETPSADEARIANAFTTAAARTGIVSPEAAERAALTAIPAAKSTRVPPPIPRPAISPDDEQPLAQANLNGRLYLQYESGWYPVGNNSKPGFTPVTDSATLSRLNEAITPSSGAAPAEAPTAPEATAPIAEAATKPRFRDYFEAHGLSWPPTEREGSVGPTSPEYQALIKRYSDSTPEQIRDTISNAPSTPLKGGPTPSESTQPVTPSVEVQSRGAAPSTEAAPRYAQEGEPNIISKLGGKIRNAITRASTQTVGPEPLTRNLESAGEPIMQKMRVGDGEEVRTAAGIDPRLIPVIAKTMYSKETGVIVPKELLQNAVDAVRTLNPKNAKVSIDVDTTNRKFTVTDNGVGMLPDVVVHEFTDLGGTLKQSMESSGGFGLAKGAMFYNASDIDVHTIAVDPKTGNKILTHVTGSGADWLDHNKGLKVVSTEAPHNTPTGTNISITLNPDAKFDSYETSTFLNHFNKNHQLPFNVDIKMDDLPYKRSADADEATTKTTTLKVPGADIDIYTGGHTYETSYPRVFLLNHGLPQSDIRIGLEKSAKLPFRIIADIRSTAGPDSGEYPWQPNRERLRDEADKALTNYIWHELAAAGIRSENELYKSTIREAPLIKGSSQRIVDTSGEIPKQVLEEMAGNIHVRRLNLAITSALNGVRDAIISEVQGLHLGKYSNFEYGGIGLGKDYYGVNVDGRSIFGPDSKNLIYINPANIAEWADKTPLAGIEPAQMAYSAETGKETPLYSENVYPERVDLAARRILATVTHELTHQVYRGHDESFSSGLTSNTAHTYGKLDSQYEALKEALSADDYQAYDYFLDLYSRVQKSLTGREDIFAKIGEHARTEGNEPAPSAQGAKRDEEQGAESGRSLPNRGTGTAIPLAPGSETGRSTTVGKGISKPVTSASFIRVPASEGGQERYYTGSSISDYPSSFHYRTPEGRIITDPNARVMRYEGSTWNSPSSAHARYDPNAKVIYANRTSMAIFDNLSGNAHDFDGLTLHIPPQNIPGLIKALEGYKISGFEINSKRLASAVDAAIKDSPIDANGNVRFRLALIDPNTIALDVAHINTHEAIHYHQPATDDTWLSDLYKKSPSLNAWTKLINNFNLWQQMGVHNGDHDALVAETLAYGLTGDHEPAVSSHIRSAVADIIMHIYDTHPEALDELEQLAPSQTRAYVSNLFQNIREKSARNAPAAAALPREPAEGTTRSFTRSGGSELGANENAGRDETAESGEQHLGPAAETPTEPGARGTAGARAGNVPAGQTAAELNHVEHPTAPELSGEHVGQSESGKTTFVKSDTGEVHGIRSSTLESAPPERGPTAYDIENLAALTREVNSLHTGDPRQPDKGMAAIPESVATRFFDRLWKATNRWLPDLSDSINDAEHAYHSEDFARATLLSEKAINKLHNLFDSETAKAMKSGITAKEINQLREDNWRDVIENIRNRINEVPPVGGLATYDVNRYPKGGLADYQKVAYILDPAWQKIKSDALHAIQSGALKAAEFTDYARRELQTLFRRSDMSDWHRLNKQAAYGILLNRVRNLEYDPKLKDFVTAPPPPTSPLGGGSAGGGGRHSDYIGATRLNVSAEPTTRKTALDIREEYSGVKNLQQAIGNQHYADFVKAVPDQLTREAVYALNEVNGDRARLQQYYQDPSKSLDATPVDSKHTYREIINAALNLKDPKALEWAQKLRDAYDEIGDFSRSLGTINNVIEGYQNRIYEREPTASTGTGKKLSTYTGHSQPRSFESFFDAITDPEAPQRMQTMDAAKAYVNLNHEMSKANTNAMLVEALTRAGIGEEISGSVPKGYVAIPGLDRRFAIPTEPGRMTNIGGTSPNATPRFKVQESPASIIDRHFVVPEGIAKGLAAIMEPNKMEQFALWRTLDRYQNRVKFMSLGYSLFHPYNLVRTFLNQLRLGGDPSRLPEVLQTARNTDSFKAAERDFIRHTGMTTRVEPNQDAFANMLGHDTVLNKLESLPVIKQAIQGANLGRRFTFDGIQRYTKVMSYANEVLRWINEHPSASDRELVRAKRDIAQEINAAQGGLNWEQIGVTPTVRAVMRMFMLAPDWTTSNIATFGQATTGGIKGTLAKRQLLFGTISSAILLEAMNHFLTGHFTDKNEQGHEMDLEVGPGVYLPMFSGATSDVARIYNNIRIYGPGAGTSKFVRSKASPISELTLRASTGKDPLGRDVYIPYNPSESQLTNAAKQVSGALNPARSESLTNPIMPVPFGARSVGRYATEVASGKRKPTVVGAIATASGLGRLSSGTGPRTAAEKLIDNINQYHGHENAHGDAESEEKYQLKSDIINRIRSGDMPKAISEASSAARSGKLSADDAADIRNDAKLSHFQYQFKHMVLEDALTVYSQMSPEEKKATLPILSEKIHSTMPKRSPEQKKVLLDRLKQLNLTGAQQSSSNIPAPGPGQSDLSYRASLLARAHPVLQNNRLSQLLNT